MKNYVGKVISVTWLDACWDLDLVPHDELDQVDLLTITTIGKCVRDDEVMLSLAHEIHNDRKNILYKGVTHIPAVNVVNVNEYK